MPVIIVKDEKQPRTPDGKPYRHTSMAPYDCSILKKSPKTTWQLGPRGFGVDNTPALKQRTVRCPECEKKWPKFWSDKGMTPTERQAAIDALRERGG